MRKDTYTALYATVPARTTIPLGTKFKAGRNFLIDIISMTGPSTAGCSGELKWNGQLVEMWHGDKVIQKPQLNFNADGVATLEVNLTNGSSNPVIMGCTIYHEELG